MSIDLTLNEQLLISRQCEQLVIAAADFADRQEFVAMAELFTEDAKLSRPTSDTPLVGRQAILESYQSRPASRLTRHICTNFKITIEDQDHARVHCYAVVYAGDTNQESSGAFGVEASQQLIGEFDDQCVRTEQGWKIAHRNASFVMHAKL